MIASLNALWRNWDFLTTILVPILSRLPGGPRSWFPADTAGAVALVAAWQAVVGDGLGRLSWSAGPGGSGEAACSGGVDGSGGVGGSRGWAELSRLGAEGPITVFAPAPSDGVSPLVLSQSELRVIPPRVRYTLFKRRQEGWAPAVEITDRIRLSEPAAPVGLVVLPDRPDREEASWDGQHWDGRHREVRDWEVRDRGERAWEEMADRALGRLCRGGLLLSQAQPWAALEDGRVEPAEGLDGVYRATADPRPPAAGWREDEDADTLTRYQGRADLVANYASLARSLARRISRRGESIEDLEQVALLALTRAARRFDHRPDVSFSGYATTCIVGELKRYFRDRSWSVRVPRSLQESYLTVRDTAENLAVELSRSPTVPEIAERAGLTTEAVLEAMEAGTSRWARSLDARTSDSEDEGTEVPVVDEGFDRTLERMQVERLAGRLDEREALIVRRIYFDGVTQRQVAADMGVSQMQVSRLLRRALEKLRS